MVTYENLQTRVRTPAGESGRPPTRRGLAVPLLAAMMVIGGGGYTTYEHFTKQEPCETSTPIREASTQVAKIPLPEQEHAFLSLWSIEHGVHVGISKDIFGTIEAKKDIPFASIGAGPEMTYPLDAVHKILIVDVNPDEINTRCIDQNPAAVKGRAG